MRQIILGTAGHIDHGKTSLIKALTGTNTDRLKEEQSRGITIELGFASLALTGGYLLGIVDVPGHEKFVKNMVAGATGIDILAMIVAADEGIMPQTREHMEICSLLGIKHGLIVLTKIDMVDNEWVNLVKEDITEFMHGTFLEGAPIISVSSITGQGLPLFLSTLSKLCSEIPKRSSLEIFRLPVDRVFTMKGFGTVITGTLSSGKVSVGDSVIIYPSKIQSKVRGIQVHNKSVQTAKAGMRTAINFQGLEKNKVKRGDVVVFKNTLSITYILDLLLKFLKSNKKPMKNRLRVRFYTGTNEIMGTLVLMDRDEILPGEECFAQIHLESPIAPVNGDRFVIRTYSPIRTIGGGKIINPIPKKRKRFQEKTLSELKILAKGNKDEIIQYHIKSSGSIGISFNDLILAARIRKKELRSKIASALNKRNIVQIGKENITYIHSSTFKILINHVVELLKDYHSRYPIKMGMPKEELKSQLSFDINSKLFTSILNNMVKNKKISIEKELIKISDHAVELKIDQEKISNQIIEIYQKNKLTPPYFKDIAKKISIEIDKGQPILNFLVDKNILVKVKEELYYHKDVLNIIEKKLITFLVKNNEITTSQFKVMIGTSRKYVIPLIEYFDSIKVTIRVGDIRKLRKQQ